MTQPTSKYYQSCQIWNHTNANWRLDLYKHIQGEDDLILKGFKEAGIYKAINDAQEIFEIVEKPFRA